MADHFFQLGFSEFVGKFRAVDGDGRYCARINQLFDSGALRGLQKIFRSADVRIVNLPGASRPQAVIRCYVKDALHALHSAIERSRVAQIPGHVFERQVRNRAISA